MKYCLLASLILFLLEIFIFFAKVQNAGSGFSSSFSKAIGFILRGHLLAEFDVDQLIDCGMRCMLGSNCLSLNIIRRANGSLTCQLNSGLRENAASEQFVVYGTGEYYGLKDCFKHGESCDTVSSWYTFNQSYFQHVKTNLTWHKAREVCQANKGDLASISSQEEQKFLYETFIKNNANLSHFVYVGLNDIKTERNMSWSDGSPVTYAEFATGEPNKNGSRGNGEGEDCVSFDRNNGKFNHVSCNFTGTFICKMDYESLLQQV